MKRALILTFLMLSWLALFSGCAVMLSDRDLETTGIQAEAEILAISSTGIDVNDDPVVSLKVRVRPKDGEPYEATIKRLLISRLDVPQFQPGAVIRVRFDAKNPTRVTADITPREAAGKSGNPYRDGFTPAKTVGIRVLQPPAQPEVYLGGPDQTVDFQILLENGYAPLGFSEVESGGSDPRQAVDQGKQIGAALVVLYGKRFDPAPGVTLTALPFHQQSPDASAADEGNEGTIGSLPATSAKGRVAVFWGKTKPQVLGIGARALHADEKARLRRDTGIVIEGVTQGSPAAAAHIQAGDVVLAIDGKKILDPAAVPAFLDSVAGKKVRIDLLRNGAPLSVTVQLNNVEP